MANRYWVGGSGTWDTTTTHWSATSGGGAGATAPTAADSVFFDQAGSYTVTMTGALSCLDFTVSAGTPGFAPGTSPTLTIAGSLTLTAGTTWTSTGAITFNATTTGKTISAVNVIPAANVTFNGAGSWQLNSNVSFGTSNATTLTAGTITCNGFTLAVGTFTSTGTGVRSIAFGTGSIELQSALASTSLSMATVTNFTCSGTGGFTSAMNVTRTFTFGTTGGTSANAPNLLLYTGSSAPTITTGSWFNTLSFSGSTGTATAATVNVNSINTTGAGVASLSVNMVGTGTITGINPISALTINTTGTVTFNNAVSCTTYTHTAGTTDFAFYNLTCSSTGTFTVGTLNNIGTISCTVWTVNGATFAFSQGTLNPSGGVLVSSGSFTYSGTANLASLTGFSQSGGSVTFNKNYSLNATATYTLTAGTLTVGDGVTLSVGVFSSTGTGVRSIAFGVTTAGNISLINTTAAVTALSCANATGFTYTGTGGFIADASITRTYVFGTTNGLTTNCPNLTLTGNGTAVQTITSGSGFNKLDFGTTAFTVPTTTAWVNSVTLSPSGTFSNMTALMFGTGTIVPNGNTTLGALTINSTSGTTTLSAALTLAATGTVTLTSGTLTLNGFNLTTGIFSSNNSNTRSVNFGSNNIVLAHTTAATTVLTCATATGFSWTGTGGFVSDASITRTYTFGTTNGSITIAPNLSITSGAATQTFTGGSWFNALNFTGTTSTVTASSAINVNSIILATGGTYTGLNLTMAGAGTLTNNGKAIAGFGINTASSFTLSAPLSCTTYTQTAGTIDFASYNLTCSSTATYFAGTLLNVGTISCTSWYVAGAFTFSQGTINPSTSFEVSSGSFTYNTGATLFTPAAAFVLTAGTATLNQSYSCGAVTVTAGTLTLNANLSAVSFLTTGNAVRNITFGTGTNITVSGASTVWDASGTNISTTGTPIVNVTYASATPAIIVNSGALPEAQAINFNFLAGSYPLTFLGTAGHTAGNVNFTGYSGTLAATQACTVYGNYTLSSGMTVTTSANTLTFGATSGTKTITTNNKTFPPISINGLGGTFNLSGNLTSSGNVQVLAGTFNTTTSNYAITALGFDSSTNTNIRSVNFNASTVLLTGTAGLTLDSTNLTFNAGTSQITLSNATSTVLSALGGVSFYNVSVTGGAPIVTVTGTNVYNTLSFANGGSIPSVVSISNNQTINGTFSSSNSTTAINRLQLQSSTFNGPQITISAGAVALYDVDFNSIIATGAAGTFTGVRLGDLGNNSNITFATPKTVYWNLPAGGNWNAIAWATSSGGTPNVNNFPLAQDTCNITSGINSTSTVTVNANWNIGTFTFNASGTEIFATGTTSPTFFGTTRIVLAATKVTGTGTWIFASNATAPNGVFWFSGGFTIPQNINVNSLGTWALLGAVTQSNTSTFTLTNGTLSLNGYTVTTGIFSSNNSNTRSILFGAGYIYLTYATAAAVNLDMATLTGFSYTASSGGFNAAMGVTRTFNSGTTVGNAASAPPLILTGTASIPTINGSWFGLLDFTTSTGSLGAQTVNCTSLTLSTGGTYTGLSVNNYGGTINTNGKTISALTLLNGNPTFSAIACGAFAVNGATFNLNGATLTPTSITVASGSFTYTSGTLASIAGFAQTGGSVTFNTPYSLTATGSYTLTSGALALGANLTTGTFVSNNTNVRSISFGSNNIILATTSASLTNLSMADLTNFSYTSSGTFGSGTGCFQSTMSVARTFTVGTIAGGSNTNAPTLYLDSGASVATLTTGGWFNELNYGTTSFAQAATNLNLNSLYSANRTTTLASLTATMVGTGSIDTGGAQGPIVINSTSGTTSLIGPISCTTCALTSGTLNITTAQSGALTCSSTFTFTDGTLYNQGTIACTTFTLNGPTYDFSIGTINASAGFTITSGALTYGGTASLGLGSGAIPFTHTAGNVTFNKSFSLNPTSTYTFTAGNLILADGVILTTGIFSSNNSNTRSITFGTSAGGNISLIHTTAATVVLSMASIIGLTPIGPGGFIADASITRTYTVGSSSASTGNSPSLTIQYGAAVATFTTGSWFNKLDFGSTTFTIGTTTLNIEGSLLLSAIGTYTSLSVNALGAGNISTAGKTIAAFTANSSGTIYFDGVVTGAITLTAGTITLGSNISSATFASAGSAPKTLLGNNKTYTITGSGATAFSNTGTNLTLDSVTISMTSATAKTFAAGVLLLPTAGISAAPIINQGGAGALTISGSNSYANITNTYSATGATSVIFTGGTTNTFLAFNLTGTVGKICTLGSTNTTQATLQKYSAWLMGASSTNVSNNTNLTFASGGNIDYLSVSYILGVVLGNPGAFFFLF